MRKAKSTLPPGFLPSKPQRQPIAKMTIRELHDQYHRNRDILASPTGSSATIARIQAEQIAIEARLADLEGIDAIRSMLEGTKLNAEEDMVVDKPEKPSVSLSPTSLAKQKALSRFAARTSMNNEQGRTAVGSLSLEEAIDIERETNAFHRERHRLAEEKRLKHSMPRVDEVLTRQEREARIWAFMNAKPSDSDLEDDDDEGSDEEDPSRWFEEDDQDDGRKGQNITEPDIDADDLELSKMIRVDANKLHGSMFYDADDDYDSH